MSNHEEDNEGLPNDLARGINGIFRGLTSLVNAAAKLTESTDAVEIARNGSFGVHDGVQAAYGITVGPGPQRPAARPVRSFRRPVARPPRSFRRRTESARSEERRVGKEGRSRWWP